MARSKPPIVEIKLKEGTGWFILIPTVIIIYFLSNIAEYLYAILVILQKFAPVG